MVYLSKTNWDYSKVLVFWRENLAMLAVPKTGTTAIEQVLAPYASMAILNPPALKHVQLYRYERFLRPFILKATDKDLETTAVVRNPIDWLGSWYRYRSRPILDGTDKSTANVSFDDFVLEAIKGESALFARVGSQLKFLTNRDETIGATHMFRYEEMSAYVDFLETRLDRKIDLPRVNVSPQADLDLSDAVEDRLRRKWVGDFALWESI